MRASNPAPGRHPIRLLAAAAVAAQILAGCSHHTTSSPGGAPAAGCSAAVNERLDPRSTIHLFASANEPRYLTDPPTSGPHLPGLPYSGVLSAPIPRPSQVAMLESGYILLQHGDLPADQTATLANLAGELVTVAPPVRTLPAAVVATAWTWKLECGSMAPAAMTAIHAFVTAHQGVGFRGNIPSTTSPSTTFPSTTLSP